jgi:hypothetical protein
MDFEKCDLFLKIENPRERNVYASFKVVAGAGAGSKEPL